MSVLMVSEWTGTVQQYDACTERLIEQVGLDQRCTFHAMALIGEGKFSVTEVWESPQAVQEWFRKAMPVIEQAGIQKERQDFYDLYNVQMGAVAEQLEQERNRMQEA